MRPVLALLFTLASLLPAACDGGGPVCPREGPPEPKTVLYLLLDSPEQFAKLAAACADVDDPQTTVTFSEYLEDTGKQQHWHLSAVAIGTQEQATCYREAVLKLGGSPTWPP